MRCDAGLLRVVAITLTAVTTTAAAGGAQSVIDAGCTLPESGAVPGLVQPGDAIRLRIWLPEEELAADFPVDDRGYAVLPRLGARRVGGLAAAQVHARLIDELEDAYPNTVIEAAVLRRVLVRGAVREPGSFHLAPYEATVGGALSEARGVTPDGRADRVELLRGNDLIVLRTGGGCRLTGLRLQSGDELNVPERSWFSRNPALVPALVSSALTGLLTLLIVTLQ